MGHVGKITKSAIIAAFGITLHLPASAVFLSTDPVGYADQLNLYAYVHNDPLNNFDTTGEFTIRVGVKAKAPTPSENVAGAHGEVGIAFSFPTPFEEGHNAFDVGIYREFGGNMGGSQSIAGIGKAGVVIGGQLGDVQDLNGNGGEVSFQLPYKYVPGKSVPTSILKTLSRTGGAEFNFDENGNLIGIGLVIGAGAEVSGAGTQTDVIFSLQSVGQSDTAKRFYGSFRNPIKMYEPGERLVRGPWDEPEDPRDERNK